MASLQIKLDLFPTEIIQRIASFSSCESVLALLKVNRQLYKICNDGLVFRSIIRNGNGHGVSKPWACDLLSQTTSTFNLARLALADSRARAWLASIERRAEREVEREKLKNELIPEGEPLLGIKELLESEQLWNEDRSQDTNHMTPAAILKWAPQLVALHHPFISEGKMMDLVAQFQTGLTDDLSLDPNSVMAMSFCITATILHNGLAVTSDGRFQAHFHLQENLRQIINATQLSYSSHILVALACALIGNGHAAVGRMPPPSPYRIPFQSLSGICIPFSGDNFVREAYLPVMTSVPFLESGEWVGYYSYSMNLHPARFDPPMERIQFAADPELGSYGLQASGVDSVGSFTLNGSVSENGVVEMTKTYAQGFSWKWNASMTPFGIVGAWGRGNTSHGHLWLWKREWSYI